MFGFGRRRAERFEAWCREQDAEREAKDTAFRQRTAAENAEREIARQAEQEAYEARVYRDAVERAARWQHDVQGAAARIASAETDADEA